MLPVLTPSTSPYYSEANCDPLCVGNVAIQNQDGYCTNPICVIDDITVTALNSGNPNITLSQYCGSPNNEGDYSYCYIGDVSVTGQAQVDISSNCDQCYSFTDNIAESKQINCDGSDWDPTQPDGPTKDQPDGKSWYKHWIVIGALIIIGVLVLLGFGIGYYYRHKKVVQPEIEVYDPSDAYYNFDFSDFDFSGYQ